MHRLAALCFALALAGCATLTVPAAIPQGGERYEFASAITAQRLASCAAYNARVFSGLFASEVDELVRPENFQVTVRRIGSWSGNPIIVGRTAPIPGGSQIMLLHGSGTRQYRARGLDRAHAQELRIRNPHGQLGSDRADVPRDALPAQNPPSPPIPAVPPPAARETRRLKSSAYGRGGLDAAGSGGSAGGLLPSLGASTGGA